MQPAQSPYIKLLFPHYIRKYSVKNTRKIRIILIGEIFFSRVKSLHVFSYTRPRSASSSFSSAFFSMRDT